MDFAQALDQETSAVRSRLCKVGKILETMPPEDADTARAALQSEALAHGSPAQMDRFTTCG